MRGRPISCVFVVVLGECVCSRGSSQCAIWTTTSAQGLRFALVCTVMCVSRSVYARARPSHFVKLLCVFAVWCARARAGILSAAGLRCVDFEERLRVASSGACVSIVFTVAVSTEVRRGTCEPPHSVSVSRSLCYHSQQQQQHRKQQQHASHHDLYPCSEWQQDNSSSAVSS